MSNVIMTVRVMPTGVEVDLDKLENNIREALKGLVEGEISVKTQPIAFGLKALDITLMATEDNGSKIEDELNKVSDVQSVSVQSISLA